MCNLCNPKRKDWSEKNFYGYQCSDCSTPDKAFVVFDKHKGELTESEVRTFNELCKKYYPNLKCKNLTESRHTCLHWYEYLFK